jgi:hypothetical protein
MQETRKQANVVQVFINISQASRLYLIEAI